MNGKKLVVFDMDDTLITNNKWVDVNTFLGVSDDDDYRLYTQFKDGLIDYQEWMRQLDALYDLENNRVSRAEITPILQDITLRDGAAALIDHLHSKGYVTAIITGSFAITAQTIAAQTGIKHVVANTHCIFNDKDRLVEIHSNGTESTMKNRYLLELCQELQIDSTKDCYVIGDSIYDQPMFMTTGKGITFNHATKELKMSALHCVDGFADLQKLLLAMPAIYIGIESTEPFTHLL